MWIKKKYIIIIALSVLLIGGILLVSSYYHSYQGEEISKSSVNKENAKKSLEDVNKFLVQKDEERIRSFIRRRDWNMQKTGSGLWYQIYQNDDGPDVNEGDYVKLDYEIRLLDGTLCYTSDSTGAKIFRVGATEEVTGLHEGLQLLTQGDKARLIIPPHLAHGLMGDSERIPARAILVYDLVVQKVSQEKISP
ncbi:MAG: FKBP-type peptidyl-prolyl cis-trans isomerase [Bacteroidota bacterium]